MSEFRILIVDDEPSITKLLAAMLTMHGYDVTRAHSASAGLEVLDAEPVDIVISDVNMPGMSGVELMSRVVKSKPHVRRILTTGALMVSAEKTACGEPLFHNSLAKPFSMAELVDVIGTERRALGELSAAA